MPTAVQHQASAVKDATAEGLLGATIALACSSAVVLGACKLFPAFNRSLSVSGKTALIVSVPAGLLLDCCPPRMLVCRLLLAVRPALSPARSQRAQQQRCCWLSADPFGTVPTTQDPLVPAPSRTAAR